MSIYEFECAAGHVTEGHYALADRPASIKCEHEVLVNGDVFPCSLDAKHVLSATPTTFRAQDRKAFKRQGH
jgi:hypothetical protein